MFPSASVMLDEWVALVIVTRMPSTSAVPPLFIPTAFSTPSEPR